MKDATKPTPQTKTNQGIPQSRETKANGRKKTTRRARTIRTSKPRSDSTLDGLPTDRKEQLACWLLDENRGYVEVRELAAREWGVRTSRSALGRYYTQRLVPQQLAEAEQAAEAMDGVDGPPSPRLRRGHERFGEAARRRAQQLGFMALMQPEPDWKAARVYLGIVDDFERRELTRDRLKLAERRERRCARRDAPRKSGIWKLPYEERMRHLKGVFGIAPDYEFAQWMTEEEKAIHLRPAAEARSAEVETRTAADDETGGDAQQGRGETGRQPGSEAAGGGVAQGTDEITSKIKSTSGEAAEGPGVPGSFREGPADPAVFSAGGGAKVDRSQAGRSETAPLQESAGTGMVASPLVAPLQETAGAGVGAAAECRSHGYSGAAEVSFGRVLGTESALHSVGGPAVQPVAPSARGGLAPESRTESVRGVANWPTGGLAVFAGSRPIWPRPEPIF